MNNILSLAFFESFIAVCHFFFFTATKADFAILKSFFESIIFAGPMFGSKTTKLISLVDRYQIQKKNVIVFKPRMDSRYDVSKITTHNGVSLDSFIIDRGVDIFNYFQIDKPPDIIAVDEAFMIDGIGDALVKCYKLGVSIVISSLDMSATCRPFDEIKELLPFATSIIKCSAVCQICGEDAYFTHKKFENNREIEVGGDNLYEPRCWNHHSYMNILKE